MLASLATPKKVDTWGGRYVYIRMCMCVYIYIYIYVPVWFQALSGLAMMFLLN